jgi:hypothetical protein
MASSSHELPEVVRALAQPLVEAGKAAISTRRMGEHFEIEVVPKSSAACPFAVLGVVLSEVTLSVGKPRLDIEIWTGEDDAGRTALASYLEAIFAGRVKEVAWVKGGRVTKGQMTFELAGGAVAKHRYSNELFRAGDRVATTFEPY